ncbi:MAG TPA: tetratricopeptide repeat protein [bacterium]|nr:tetratricopeptide repeat protein [bacterium]HPO07460.1 tetratricopeptide repeat protein [bacterium]HQP97743.1 tetratricopeptide repeat protein [bacterium]
MDLVQQGKELAQEGNFAEALDIFKKALEADPRNPDILFFVGTCHSSLGDFPGAKYYYQEALKIDPNHSRTKMVWGDLEEVEARAPSDARPAKPMEPEPEPEEEPSPPVEEEEEPEPMNQLGVGSTDEFRDKWADAFPTDQYLKSTPRKKGIGVWFWILVVLAIAAAVYFWLGPKYLQP